MTIFDNAIAPGRRRLAWSLDLSPAVARGLLLAALAIAAGLGAFGSDAASVASAQALAGDDLTRLLRLMAAIKAVIALGAVAAVLWRLGVAVSLPWFAAYALAGSAMVAGPGLIWGMAHVGLGALLLHGGLVSCLLLLWRDPAVAGRLEAMLAARRRRRRPAR